MIGFATGSCGSGSILSASLLRGRGGSEVDSHFFFLFLIEENGSYLELFRNEKNLFLVKVIKYSNRGNTYNCICIACANFNRDFPKVKFKIYLLLESYSFWDKCLKLDSYVLRPQKWTYRILKMSTMPKIIRNEIFEI